MPVQARIAGKVEPVQRAAGEFFQNALGRAAAADIDKQQRPAADALLRQIAAHKLRLAADLLPGRAFAQRRRGAQEVPRGGGQRAGTQVDRCGIRHAGQRRARRKAEIAERLRGGQPLAGQRVGQKVERRFAQRALQKRRAEAAPRNAQVAGFFARGRLRVQAAHKVHIARKEHKPRAGMAFFLLPQPGGEPRQQRPQQAEADPGGRVARVLGGSAQTPTARPVPGFAAAHNKPGRRAAGPAGSGCPPAPRRGRRPGGRCRQTAPAAV